MNYRRCTLLAAAIAAIILPASVGRAADLPVKAPVITPFFLDTSGWYWGIEAGAGVQQASANGTPLLANSLVSGSLTASGGTVGGCVGYIRGNATQWLGFQGCLDYQNITAGETVAGSNIGMASRWSGTVEVRWGGSIDPLATISSTLANLGVSNVTFPSFTPIPPGGINVGGSAPRSYIAGGFEAFGVRGNVGMVNSANVAFAPMLKVGAIWPVFDKLGKPTGGAVDVSAMVSWPMRGFEINNLGGPGGPSFAGGLDTGTRYMGKVAFLFPVPR